MAAALGSAPLARSRPPRPRARLRPPSANDPPGASGGPASSKTLPRRASLFAAASTALAPTLLSRPAPSSALDLDALAASVRDANRDILRVADPEHSLDVAETELERALGRPGAPESPPGVTPGENPGERDVVTLATGVSYADVSLGRGDPVRTADLVVAHLVGATPDGREFENTYARGAALAFTLGVRPPGVPEGLEEAIAGMRAGGRRLVAVPPRMGFGDRAVRAPLARVPPNASLLYEVELLRCVPVEAAAVAAGGSAPGERICCSDENYPCDPIRAAEEGGRAEPSGFDR